jgi:hypothetical protein
VISGSKYFTVLDSYVGFWQVPIRKEHRERTGFSVPSGHYEFNRLRFGLSNSPSNFQRLMDNVLKNLSGTECLVYTDDVIVFSRTPREHAQRVSNVLQRFADANLKLHQGKWSVTQPQVNYLRFTSSEKGSLPCMIK